MKKITLMALIMLLGFGFSKAQTSGDEDKVYPFVSIKNPPTFPGGMNAFYKFLGDNMKYPEQAKKDKTQGTVFVSFVVEKDGSINDIKIDRSLSTATDQEAKRVLALSPKWIAGTLEGKAIRVKYNMPIRFTDKTAK
ncbi:energy transducer TonB [Pedobacter ureilyticus]|uniref:Energy transducer TonB n=1 Tax=Pedobacter ureilyticus TaxID=1393051 RepID=A0ABW9J605_9SPHI